MKLQNTFVESRMNQDIDERLLPKGQYPDALNIRVSNSEGSDVGAIENTKGNEQLTSLGLTGAETIGAFADGSAQKIYWFITSNAKDLVVEYDVNNTQTNILLESSKPSGVLNFNKNNLITGVVKIINGDSDRDLLIWTDDLNPPRVINIERAKTYAADGFVEQDISLIKRSPRYAPNITLTYNPSTTENNLANRFLSFSYRYKYLDGGNSPLSSFTNYAFAPSEFDLDFQTMENKGMSNNFSAVKIDFNTGTERVTDVELVYKESGSNTLYLIESFNKANEVWGDNETQSFTFSNTKGLTALPEEELFRTFDNIPRKAKALELIGSRIAFGNYLENYDLTNIYGEDININYSLSLTSLDLTGVQLPLSIVDVVALDDGITLDFTGITLQRNNRITVSVEVSNTEYSGSFIDTFDFILNQDFVDAAALAADVDFIYFVETLMTAAFTAGYTITPVDPAVVDTVVGFLVNSSTATSITIQAPVVTFDDAGVADFIFETDTDAFYKEIAVDSSLKTNRSYEVGLIYMDADGRTTTVLTDEDNTINVEQQYSVNQNKIVTNINHNPPYWADRYKLVVKQNKGNYQTIYTNLFYEEGLFRWVKLEGANINKVKEGDTLIVKSDLGGALADPVRVRVLEIATKDRDFILDNEDSDGSPIIEESGVYMKIKPTGFDMNFDNSTARTYEGSSHLRYTVRTYTNPSLGTYDDIGTFVPYTLNAGSRVRIYINFKARGSISFNATYDQRFRVNGSYASIKDWFEAEVEDLGSFGENFTRDDGSGGGVYDYSYGFSKTGQDGFTQDGEKFYAWSHRDGTASRKVTTTISFEVISSDGIVIFETEPEDKATELFYETAQTFDIVNNYHQGNIQNQGVSEPTAIVELDFFNCYVQGNGAESYRYLDAYNVGTDDDGQQLLANFLNIDLRPSTTNPERYREVRRYADITYSEPYNENSNLNGLGVFNLSKANYKEDIEKKYGFIQRLYARDTNLVVFQEDKVSYVLFGKDVITNADGSGNISALDEVLGQQIMYTGEYGISRNPESFAFDANNLYFIDAKRGCVCRLGAQGITEISMAGMRTFFRDDFKNNIDNKKLGSYDPYLNQYVVHSSDNLLVQPVDMDCSGSFYRGGVSGTYIINIDYGVLVGDAGFTYNFNNNVTATFEYDGVVANLGTLVGDGTYVFTKVNSLPRVGTLTLTASECDTNLSVTGDCIDTVNLNVVSVILNDVGDEGKLAKSRYKWSTGTYSSPFTTKDSIFDEAELQLYENVLAVEGSVKIPLTGSTVRVEDYNGFSQTVEWVEGQDRLGYLISNTLYTDADIAALTTAATFPAETKVINGDGSVTRFIEFPFTRGLSEQYLYLIWDYVLKNQAPVAVDDNFSATKGAAVVLNVLANDSDPDGDTLTPVINTGTANGTLVVNIDGTITYTHDNSNNLADSFTYYVTDGQLISNIATVNLVVGISAGDSINASGAAGVYLVPLVVGTEAGEFIAHFNAQSVPDRFEILFDNAGLSNDLVDMEVVADSLFVGDGTVDDTTPFDVPPNGTTPNLDLFTYNGTTFDTTEVGTQTITVSDSDVAGNLGSRSDATPNGISRNGSGASQVGVQNLVYTSAADVVGTSGLNFADGNIALKFTKPVTTAFTAYIRVSGLSGTAWNLFQTEFNPI